MDAYKRNNVHVVGNGPSTVVFAHGFGFDQTIWHYVAKELVSKYRLVALDLVGSGQSDTFSYDPAKYGTLYAHADDLLEIIVQAGNAPVVLVGHSVGAIIGMLATIKAPERFSGLVMIGPTPSLINEGDYIGGFEQVDIDELLGSLESNYLGWSNSIAPAVLGMQAQSGLGAEFASSFCRNDPEVGKHFARVTFLSDHRAELARVTTPTLIVQSSDDPFVPLEVSNYMHRMIQKSVLAIVQSTGHCPHISAPRACIDAIEAFIKTLSTLADGQSKETVADNQRDA
ncbi:alpha/beta hydrolase [Caballeronia sp. dw_276]|uniref:alpha/beta fold hydrolase n=1 Tax=Caballeronia sp. dw_276 TaxID=2719795 RepID=UPI001BD54C5B|nr:alpha/beta hydrolase [Caballeronia sp. dw_276]